jgi:hypothetical protein
MRNIQWVLRVVLTLFALLCAMLIGYGIASVIAGGGSSARFALEAAEPSASPHPQPTARQAVLSGSSEEEPTSSTGDPAAAAPQSTAAEQPVESPTVDAPQATGIPTADSPSPPAPTAAEQEPSATASPVPPTATQPAPTSTPPPSATALPSATPQPTPTSPPSATATLPPPTPTSPPARPTPTTRSTAVVAASAVPTELVLISDTFRSATSGWPIQETDDWSSSYVDGHYELALHGETRIGISYPLRVRDYRLSADVGVEGGGAGLVFLFGQDNVFYWFGISADGAYTVQRLQNDDVTSVRDWTASDALPTVPGETVTLRIERKRNIVRFYADDRELDRFTVPAGEWQNRYGFLITSRNRQARATFDNLLGERLDD